MWAKVRFAFIPIGDPYKDPSKFKLREGKKDGHVGVHEHNFRPAGTVPKKVTSDFDHKSDYVPVNKCRKDPEGGVRTDPPNFVTNPPKKGNSATTPGVLLQKDYYDFIENPYDRRKELLKKEREEHHRKMQEKPFNGTVFGCKTFATV